MSKVLWHSELVRMGPVQVTVKSDILKSKFAGKPDYVVLEIDGADRNYSLENPSCGDVFHQQRGRVFTVVAEGREDTATVIYVGEPADDPGEPPPAHPDPDPAGTARSKRAAVPPKAPASVRSGAASAPQQRAPVKAPGRPAGASQGQAEAMRCREIRYERTVNTGNYCNEHIGIVLELGPGTKAEVALESARTFVEAHLKAEAPQHTKGGAQ